MKKILIRKKFFLISIIIFLVGLILIHDLTITPLTVVEADEVAYNALKEDCSIARFNPYCLTPKDYALEEIRFNEKDYTWFYIFKSKIKPKHEYFVFVKKYGSREVSSHIEDGGLHSKE